jgi:hypothetical protein
MSVCDAPVSISKTKLTDANWPTMNSMPNSYLDMFELTDINNKFIIAK